MDGYGGYGVKHAELMFHPIVMGMEWAVSSVSSDTVSKILPNPGREVTPRVRAIDIIVSPDICLEDGDVDVGVEAGLVREVAVDAAELGVVAEDGERVQGVDQPVSMNGS